VNLLAVLAATVAAFILSSTYWLATLLVVALIVSVWQ
jgi:hypothetical protein